MPQLHLVSTDWYPRTLAILFLDSLKGVWKFENGLNMIRDEYLEDWTKLRKVFVKYFTGLVTHRSCDVLKQYGIVNKQIKEISWYFTRMIWIYEKIHGNGLCKRLIILMYVLFKLNFSKWLWDSSLYYIEEIGSFGLWIPVTDMEIFFFTLGWSSVDMELLYWFWRCLHR